MTVPRRGWFLEERAERRNCGCRAILRHVERGGYDAELQRVTSLLADLGSARSASSNSPIRTWASSTCASMNGTGS